MYILNEDVELSINGTVDGAVNIKTSNPMNNCSRKNFRSMRADDLASD